MHQDQHKTQEEFTIGIQGVIHCFQTELDYVKKNGILVPIDTGIVVPGSVRKQRNTIQNALVNYLAFTIGSSSVDIALDSLFATDGTQASVGAAEAGNDGIVVGTVGPQDVTHILTTTKNDGGLNSENFIEFYGTIDGAQTLSGLAILGFNYSNAGNGSLETIFSQVNISETVAANRRYHHYWKLTITITAS